MSDPSGSSNPYTTTPVPSHLIDDLLPTLKDTELRVLLVVLRQTVGRGKPADWLSHTQLKARTGRASEAVSGAIDRLVALGFIAVTDASGFSLRTPTERRRHRGRLYYRPAGRVQNTLHSVSPLEKAKTTKTQSVVSCRFRNAWEEERRDEESGPRVGYPLPRLTAEQNERIVKEKQRIRERLSKLAFADAEA